MAHRFLVRALFLAFVAAEDLAQHRGPTWPPCSGGPDSEGCLAAAADSEGDDGHLALLQRRSRQRAAQASPMFQLEDSQVGPEADWEESRKPSGTEAHNVTFCVKQKNVEKLRELLMEVSEPGSDKRGQYLTHNESHEVTANPESTEKVLDWLKGKGLQVVQVGSHGKYIRVQAPVSTWENLLNTKFAYMRPKAYPEDDDGDDGDGELDEEQLVLRAVEHVHLPDGMEEHISCAFGTTQLPPRRRTLSSASSAHPKYETITPERLRSFYKVTGEGSPRLSQAVLEFGGTRMSIKDLRDFQAKYSEDAPKATIAVDIGGHVVQPETPLESSKGLAEPNLDVQYLTAMAPSTRTTYWWLESYEQWVEHVSSMAEPPQVISISYGALESAVSKTTVEHFNTECMRLGTRGVSIIVSSGDNGALTGVKKDPSKGPCFYGASFPAISPYVTAVGATMGGAQGGPEVACMSAIFSGGGFSKTVPGPMWQAPAVMEYFATVSPKPAPGYNVFGRAFPDVAMPGNKYSTIVNGKPSLMDGTSASAPTFAGLVSLLNAHREAERKHPVGFLNPTLYKAGSQPFFNDITHGNNTCRKGGKHRCCEQGYFATKGWDPVTGWGSITLPNLTALFA